MEFVSLHVLVRRCVHRSFLTTSDGSNHFVDMFGALELSARLPLFLMAQQMPTRNEVPTTNYGDLLSATHQAAYQKSGELEVFPFGG